MSAYNNATGRLNRSPQAGDKVPVIPADHSGAYAGERANEVLTAGDQVATDGTEYNPSAHSFQIASLDYNIAAAAGSNDGTNPKFQAAGMFNIVGASLTKLANYLFGVIGAYSLTGTRASTYPAGAVAGQISDGTTTADGAFVAYIDGDSATTLAQAALKVRSNNSQAASGMNFGVDLQDASHDGFKAVTAEFKPGATALFYKQGIIRMVQDVVFLVGSAAPDATVGVDIAGPGSLYVNTATGKWYTNGGSKHVPAWKIITSA